MEWRDTGLVLATRKHGETSVLLEVFTPQHGRHSGLLRGGISRKISPHIQPGAQLDLTWKARLEDQLGSFTIEPLKSRAAFVMEDRVALAGLNTVVALLHQCLPERAPYPEFYAQTEALLDLLAQPEVWPVAYLHWELALLEQMGFGLELDSCAVTGSRQGLVYVSPRTGRAVTAEGAGEFADRLLPLPPVLKGLAVEDDAQVLEGLRTTGHFMTTRIAPDLKDGALPAARAGFVDQLRLRAGHNSAR